MQSEVWQKEPINLIIAGVGGQGNILISEIVAQAACVQNWKVVVGESYGLSQRGGAVSSHVRLSREKEYGPIIPAAEADLILGFEPVEGARQVMDYGNKNTRIIINSYPVYPIGVLRGKSAYPPLEILFKKLREMVAEVLVIPATKLAGKLGNPVAQNVVMIGALVSMGYLPFGADTFLEVIKKVVPSRAYEINEKAFYLGMMCARQTD